jgi:hypothetical protein
MTTTPNRRTAAQIAQDNLTKAQGKTAAARRRLARAQAEVTAAQKAIATLVVHERYLGQHPDLPAEVRERLAKAEAERPMTGPEIDATADEDD